MDESKSVTYIGTTDYRNQGIRFGIRGRDRLQHMYIIGKSGVGKSTLLENMFVQDIQAGNGCALFDPHGKSAELMLDYIPEHRINDVIYFNPADMAYPIAFNVMEDTGPDNRNKVADGLLAAFKKIWPDAFSARMEYILSMSLLALLEFPDSTLLGVNRMLADKEYRKRIVDKVTDPTVRAFWIDEFGKWDEKFAREASAAIQNKVGQFSSNPLIRNIVGQPKSSFDFRDVIDSKKIFIANLSKGQVGEQNAPLLGGMLMTKLYLAGMSRADKNDLELSILPPFYIYVDEFQNFVNDSFANILSESRKYKLGLTMAHQYMDQIPEAIQFAVSGNVGTTITFRVGAEDAERLEKKFAPVFVQEDFVNLGPYQIYLSLLIDNLGSRPFSARTLPPIPKPERSYRTEILAASRRNFAQPRFEVEQAIDVWYRPVSIHKQTEQRVVSEKNKIQNDIRAAEFLRKSDKKPQTIPSGTQDKKISDTRVGVGDIHTVHENFKVKNNVPVDVIDKHEPVSIADELTAVLHSVVEQSRTGTVSGSEPKEILPKPEVVDPGVSIGTRGATLSAKTQLREVIERAQQVDHAVFKKIVKSTTEQEVDQESQKIPQLSIQLETIPDKIPPAVPYQPHPTTNQNAFRFAFESDTHTSKTNEPNPDDVLRIFNSYNS